MTLEDFGSALAQSSKFRSSTYIVSIFLTDILVGYLDFVLVDIDVTVIIAVYYLEYYGILKVGLISSSSSGYEHKVPILSFNKLLICL